MNFKKIMIKDKCYGELYDDKIECSEENVDFKDPTFSVDEGENLFALECLALCHNIIVSEEHGKIKYNSSSPDETALLNFSK